MFSSFVVLYLFLGGCGAAELSIAAGWSLLFSSTHTRTAQQSRVFAFLRGRLYSASFVTLAVAALCLFLDLGRPDRVLLLFARPTLSLISVGSFALLACILFAAFLAATNLLSNPRTSSTVRRIAESLSLIPAVVMLVYTGLYMAWMEAVPLWNNGALPWLIAFSSLSSGMSIVLILLSFVRDWKLLTGWIEALRRLHCVVLALEIGALAAFIVLTVLNPFAAASLADLLDPTTLGPWFVVGFGVLGVATPLASELFVPSVRHSAVPAFAEVLCIAGGLILRFCLVLAGSHWLG